jgi:hypothetical protein
MARKKLRLVLLIGLTWSVIIFGVPFAMLMAFGAAMAGVDISEPVFFGVLAAFACDAVIASVLMGVLLEPENVLRNMPLELVVPTLWAASVLNVCLLLCTQTGIPGLSWPFAGLGVPTAIALSTAWCIRHRRARQSPTNAPSMG